MLAGAYGKPTIYVAMSSGVQLDGAGIAAAPRENVDVGGGLFAGMHKSWLLLVPRPLLCACIAEHHCSSDALERQMVHYSWIPLSACWAQHYSMALALRDGTACVLGCCLGVLAE